MQNRSYMDSRMQRCSTDSQGNVIYREDWQLEILHCWKYWCIHKGNSQYLRFALKSLIFLHSRKECCWRFSFACEQTREIHTQNTNYRHVEQAIRDGVTEEFHLIGGEPTCFGIWSLGGRCLVALCFGVPPQRSRCFGKCLCVSENHPPVVPGWASGVWRHSCLSGLADPC